uniref:Uncharacterized protein n=1 Tax=Cucumis melo TaxID=3656 RepID=A0A9I9EAD8_CUCME
MLEISRVSFSSPFPRSTMASISSGIRTSELPENVREIKSVSSAPNIFAGSSLHCSFHTLWCLNVWGWSSRLVSWFRRKSVRLDLHSQFAVKRKS